MCLSHIIQGYILPKDKQSMVSVAGYHVENPLGKGREISWHYPYKGVWIIDKENLAFALNVLVENRSITDMLRDSIDMVFKQRSDLDIQRIHQEQLIE